MLREREEGARAVYQRARESHRAQRWTEAARGYEAALAGGDGPPTWYLNLGRVRERAGRTRAAARAYEAALDRDPASTALDRHLLAQSTKRFPARRAMARFVAEHLDEIQRRARETPRAGEAPDSAVDGVPPRIWVYWAQGMDAAPEVVRLCHDQLKRFHESDELVVLDDACERQLTRIPDEIRDKTGDNLTRHSDLVRLEVLSRYGGIWLDATCLVRTRVPAVMSNLGTAGFFAFTYRTGRLSSWCLASRRRHDVVTMMREAEHVFWERNDKAIDYYDLHHMFEALCHLDPQFRAHWTGTPRLSVAPPNAFRRAMWEPYEPRRFRQLLDSSFVHKLTYKYDDSQVGEDTMLGRLLERGPH
ncbi:MAG: capsular polysaccharide synthesis protein [Actinomycetes bacterium]